jgi:hypothetical protein
MIAKICWALLGLLHVLPALALFDPSRLTKMYGVERGSGNFILMHHRAALFLVIVVICVWAIFRPDVRPLATIAVGISMASFVLIWWLSGMAPQLKTIAIADMIGLPVLLLAGWFALKGQGA